MSGTIEIGKDRVTVITGDLMTVFRRGDDKSTAEQIRQLHVRIQQLEAEVVQLEKELESWKRPPAAPPDDDSPCA